MAANPASTGAALLALLVAFSARASAEEPGKALFSAAGCRSCHKVGPDGGNTGPDLTLVGFRRSRQWLDVWLTSPRAWKRDTLMPEPRLSRAARAGLVAYLSAQRGQAWRTRPWDSLPASRKGKLIFLKAGCVPCHGAGGIGGHPNNNVPGGRIPALPALVATFTLDELKREIREGDIPQKEDPAGPQPLVSMPLWAEVLTPAEIDAVAAYVMTLAKHPKGNDW